VIFNGVLLPFGEFLSVFYGYRPDILEDYKKQLKNFLVFKAQKVVSEEKIFLVNPVYLLDLYVPPLNVLVFIRVTDVNGEEKFSLEVSNYVFDVINVQEQGLGFIVEAGEKVYVEFYMISDTLFMESVKGLKHIYENSDSMYSGINSYMENFANKTEEDLKNVGYDLVGLGRIFSEKKAEEIIKIIPNLIKEVS
jgi:hypothetical protein